MGIVICIILLPKKGNELSFFIRVVYHPLLIVVDADNENV